MGRGLWGLTLTVLLAVAAFATGAHADGLTRGERVTGAHALDGAVFMLEDGREARLAALRPPDDPALAEQARALLDDLVRGRPLLLRYDVERADRRGRVVAQIFVTGGTPESEPLWAQGELLAAGLARVETGPRTNALAADMLTAEATARAARRGLWAHPDNAVRGAEPGPLWNLLDTFQIVEGEVVSAAETRDFLYLNFDDDYRTDFTISIARRHWRAVRRDGLEPLELEGRRIRVRGFLHAMNGPMIDADHAAQIEVLD